MLVYLSSVCEARSGTNSAAQRARNLSSRPVATLAAAANSVLYMAPLDTVPVVAPYATDPLAAPVIDCSNFDPNTYWANTTAFGNEFPCPPSGWQIYHFLWLIGGMCAILAAGFVILIIIKHLQHYTQPHLQRFMVRILWMIPIYSINSLLSATFRKHTVYWDVARDCYEAYVLFNFFKLLVEFGGGEEQLIRKLEQTPRINYPAPFSSHSLKPNRLFFHRCRQMILQFVWVKLLMTILIFILNLAGLYGEGSFSPKTGYLYITIFYNISITTALYFMLFFYEATKDILAEFRPMSKFLSIKAILFFSFWQGVILSILIHIGVIGPVGELSKEEFGTMLQDILICIEMVPAGAVFAFTFGYRSFRVSRPEDALEDDKSVPMKILSNFAHMASPIDVLHETGAAVSKPKRRALQMGDFWNLPLEEQLPLVKKMGWIKKLGNDVVNWWQDRYAMIIKEPRGFLVFKGNPFDLENGKLKEPTAFIDFVDVEDVIPNLKKRATRFDIHTADRVWRFDTTSELDRDSWIDTIIAMLPYGRQPLTIPADVETPNEATSPSVGHPEEIPQDGGKEAPATPLMGPGVKRAKSLTFEIKDNGEISDDEEPVVVEQEENGADSEVVPLDEPIDDNPDVSMPATTVVQPIVDEEEIGLDEIV